MSDTAAFWDRHAKGYAARPVANPDAYEATLARVRTHLTETDLVLEMGAGTGTTATKLANGVAHYMTTDISPEMVAIAETKTADMPNVEVAVAAPGTGTFPRGPYNAVLAFNLLHLLKDAEASVREARDMLVPGGLFISKTPCIKRWMLCVIGAMRLVGMAPYVRAFQIAEYDRMIEDAGFEIIETGILPPGRVASSRFVVARKR